MRLQIWHLGRNFSTITARTSSPILLFAEMAHWWANTPVGAWVFWGHCLDSQGIWCCFLSDLSGWFLPQNIPKCLNLIRKLLPDTESLYLHFCISNLCGNSPFNHPSCITARRGWGDLIGWAETNCTTATWGAMLGPKPTEDKWGSLSSRTLCLNWRLDTEFWPFFQLLVQIYLQPQTHSTSNTPWYWQQSPRPLALASTCLFLTSSHSYLILTEF